MIGVNDVVQGVPDAIYRANIDLILDRILGSVFAQRLDPLRENLGVVRVGEEAVLDRKRSPRVEVVQPDAPARARLHREHRRADLEAAVRRLDRREEEEVPNPFRASARAGADADLRHEQRSLARKGLEVALELGGRLPAEPEADVVEQVLADRDAGLGADPAAEEDRRRAVCARRQHDLARRDLAGRGADPGGAAGVVDDAVDQRVGEHGQVRPRAGRIEVRERGVPPDGPDGVHRVQDRVVPCRLGERCVPRRELVTRHRPCAELALGAVEERLEDGVAPAVAPLVVVGGRAAEDDAGVVRRAAAEDPRAQLRAILAVGLPRVGEGEPAGVEHVGRPAPVGVGTVIGSGLDEANGAVGILRQASGENAAGRPAAHDDGVEALHARIQACRG